jgi:hypothetical protein
MHQMSSEVLKRCRERLESSGKLQEYFALKMMALRSFKMSGTGRPLTQRNIPNYLIR